MTAPLEKFIQPTSTASNVSVTVYFNFCMKLSENREPRESIGNVGMSPGPLTV